VTTFRTADRLQIVTTHSPAYAWQHFTTHLRSVRPCILLGREASTMTAKSRQGRLAADLYSPAEVAKALGCSEWWVKEQARRRRIPFAWIGGAYRFTHEHLGEIVRIFEVRPTEDGEPEAAPRRRSPRTPAIQSAPLLKAKQPRRSRSAA
jgi:hypothetical protein